MLFHKDMLFYEKNRYENLLKILFALYIIGLEKFNFPNIVNKIISQYCLTYKKYFKKPSWYLQCSSLECDSCKKVVSPYNHMFEIKNIDIPYSQPLHFLFRENKYVQKFCSNSNKDLQDFLFILTFFVTLSISNRKFSIIHDTRKYNNLPPILVNINCDAITPLYQNILNYLSEIDIKLERDIKPSNVLSAIKSDKTVVFLDIEDDKRFNIVKLFTNYDENSKKCSKKITSFGHFEKSQTTSHYSIGIYNNGRLKPYVSVEKTLGRNFTKSCLFNFNNFNDTFDSSYNEEAMKSFFIEVDNLIKNSEIIKYNIFKKEFYIDDLSKKIRDMYLVYDFNKKISCNDPPESSNI